MHGWRLTASFQYQDQEVRYGVAGDGPPLVLLHGTPFSSYEWHRLIPVLARTHRVYYHDMLGYGQSAMHKGQDVSLGVQGELLAALLDHWRLDAPDVVAHDFGGTNALRAHLLHGRDYRTLTLIDAEALSPWGTPLMQHVRQHEAAFAGMPAYMHVAVLNAYLRTAMHRPISDAELQPYMAPWLGEVGQAALYRQIAQMDMRFTDEIQGRLDELRCPTQVLWGDEDTWLPLSQGHELAARLLDARFITVPGSGHLMQEDAPEAIVGEVIGFLR